MSELEDSFRAWIGRQDVAGKTRLGDSTHLCFLSSMATGHLSFIPSPDGSEIVELRIQRSEHARPSFLTHFVLTNERRARKLFKEMINVLESEERRGPVRILVCDAPGKAPSKRTKQFVERLRLISQETSITFEFKVVPLDEVPKSDEQISALVLAPCIACLQRQTYLEHPNLITVSIPTKAFDSLDANRVFRLLLEAMGEIDTLPPRTCLIPPTRLPAESKKVLLINVMYCDRCIRMGFRVYSGMREIARGKVTKAYLSMEDIDDLLQTLFLYGVPVQSLDAIEFLVPGVVNYCSMNLPSLGERDKCMTKTIAKRYGIPVFIDNNTNAAAMGCYVLQDKFESLTLYRHQLGHMNGGQGTVINGQLISGLHGMAGEPKYYQRCFCYDEPYNHKVWSCDGLAKVCLNVLRATMATIAPDVLYVSVGALDSLDEVRAELLRTLPKYCEPQIIAIDDYRERMYVGAVALCHQRL